MMPIIQKTIRRLVPLRWRMRLRQEFHLAYSQEGEDLVLERMFGGRMQGFFVDIGAHHPIRFSNTYLFYRRGWRGINIDATPGSMKEFRRLRPEDINLEFAIGVDADRLSLHRFDEPALNTVDANGAEKLLRDGRYSGLTTVSVRCRRLDRTLDEHLPAGKAIDFMSIDVEGLELQVLQSNDWQRYRPQLLVVEIRKVSLETLGSTAVHAFIADKGYIAVAKTFNTVFYASPELNAELFGA